MLYDRAEPFLFNRLTQFYINVKLCNNSFYLFKKKKFFCGKYYELANTIHLNSYFSQINCLDDPCCNFLNDLKTIWFLCINLSYDLMSCRKYIYSDCLCLQVMQKRITAKMLMSNVFPWLHSVSLTLSLLQDNFQCVLQLF